MMFSISSLTERTGVNTGAAAGCVASGFALHPATTIAPANATAMVRARLLVDVCMPMRSLLDSILRCGSAGGILILPEPLVRERLFAATFIPSHTGRHANPFMARPSGARPCRTVHHRGLQQE